MSSDSWGSTHPRADSFSFLEACSSPSYKQQAPDDVGADADRQLSFHCIAIYKTFIPQLLLRKGSVISLFTWITWVGINITHFTQSRAWLLPLLWLHNLRKLLLTLSWFCKTLITSTQSQVQLLEEMSVFFSISSDRTDCLPAPQPWPLVTDIPVASNWHLQARHWIWFSRSRAAPIVWTLAQNDGA